jgi:hypothetical protein
MENVQAKVWRERAEELRVIADSFSDAGARADLAELASKWDRMAERSQAKSDSLEPGKDGKG